MKLSNASLRVWDYGKCFRFYACEALAAKGVGLSIARPTYPVGECGPFV